MTSSPHKNTSPGSRPGAQQRPAASRGVAADGVEDTQGTRGTIPMARSVERQAARRQQARQAPARMARNFVQLPKRIHPGVTVGIALLVAFLAFSIAQPLRNYFDQRSDLAELNATIEAQERHKAELIEEINRYGNENYIKEVARTRLGLIEPGESAFRIISPKIKASGQIGSDGSNSVPGEEDPQAPGPWYVQLWDSISVPEQESVTNDNDEGSESLELPTVPEDPQPDDPAAP